MGSAYSVLEGGDMHPYVVSLTDFFAPHADPVAAVPMKAYLRDQFGSLGIKSAWQGELAKQFYTEHGLPPLADLETILADLWALPEREYQYFGIGLLRRFGAQLPPDFTGMLEMLITTKSWWDTVDFIAGEIVGSHFKYHPAVRDSTLARWRTSDDFWLRRTCILFQLGYKKDTDFPLLCEIIRENLGSKEFFINKAIGWALRQYTRVDPESVRKFVAETPLQPLSAREALKCLEKRKKKT
jgi:3-methyladenine DNA glycosylase AlkD